MDPYEKLRTAEQKEIEGLKTHLDGLWAGLYGMC